MKKALWAIGVVIIAMAMLGAALTRQPRSSAIDELIPYAAQEHTNYYDVAGIKLIRAKYSSLGAPHATIKAMSMRSLILRNVPKGKLFSVIADFKKESGWKALYSSNHALTIAPPGGATGSNMFYPQLLVTSGMKGFANMPDDARINADVILSQELTTRDMIRLRLTRLGRDPFVKP